MAIKAGVESEIKGIPTITMTVNYLAPAREADVFAEAKIIRRGRSIVFAEVRALSSSGELLATAQVVYKFGSRGKSV
jgi:acyl-coenzyme A thioesterase PaaI-like protein